MSLGINYIAWMGGIYIDMDFLALAPSVISFTYNLMPGMAHWHLKSPSTSKGGHFSIMVSDRSPFDAGVLVCLHQGLQPVLMSLMEEFPVFSTVD